MKSKFPCAATLTAIACCCTTLHADPLVILSEAFDNPSSDAPFSDYGWSVLVTESGIISDYGTQSRAIGVGSADYAFYAPKADDSTPTWTAAVLNDPALASTPLPDSYDITELISVAWDSSADNADHAYRVVVQVGGIWYASNQTFNDGFPDSGTTPANFVPLLFDPASFATASNWLTIQNTTLGANGTLSLGAAPGSDLSGEVTAIGLYLVAGVDNELEGDHVRFDNFTVTVDGPALPPLLKWATGDDNWTATDVWKDQSLAPATFADGIDVMFEDLESGTSPITVTLNDTVSPLSTTFDNSDKDFTISGTGKISGATGLTKNGTGVATLATANDHTGGVVLNAGRLNIDHASALGTGTFAINGGTIGNTSGAAIVNANNNAMEWNADFTFAGTDNLDLGTGPVTLATAGFTDLTLTSGSLTVGGIISGGSTFGLYKKGGGTLTLTGASDFTGSVIIAGGGPVRVTSLANGGQPSSLGAAAAGAGTIQIANGTLDGTLEYIGTGAVETTRQVRIGNSTPNPTTGSATLLNDQADPADTMSFTANPFNALATSTSGPNGPGDRSITLDGSNEGDNSITGEIRDNQINNDTGYISLVKSGTGTWSLSGVNTYSGDTTVTGGVLKINGTSIADTNTLIIDGGVVDVTGDELVTTLFFGTEQQADGVYGSSVSSAPAENQDDTRFSGTGTVTVDSSGGASGFTTWITAGGFANDSLLVGKDGPNDDPDNDGISNLVEYALDGYDPTTSNPTPGSISGLLVTYTKRALAVTNGDVTYSIEESTDLGISDAWATATPTTDDDSVITYTLTPPAPSKDFVRLQVLQP